MGAGLSLCGLALLYEFAVSAIQAAKNSTVITRSVKMDGHHFFLGWFSDSL